MWVLDRWLKRRAYVGAMALWIGVSCLLAADIVDAGGRDAGKSRERVDAAIAECWARSQGKIDAGTTAGMREGAAEASVCLEGVLQGEMKALLSAETYARLDLPSRLDALAESYQSIYWELYNGGRADGSWRGTMYQVFHLGKYTALLEAMIRDVAAERDSAVP